MCLYLTANDLIYERMNTLYNNLFFKFWPNVAVSIILLSHFESDRALRRIRLHQRTTFSSAVSGSDWSKLSPNRKSWHCATAEKKQQQTFGPAWSMDESIFRKVCPISRRFNLSKSRGWQVVTFLSPNFVNPKKRSWIWGDNWLWTTGNFSRKNIRESIHQKFKRILSHNSLNNGNRILMLFYY